jgi:hypothetical protein
MSSRRSLSLRVSGLNSLVTGQAYAGASGPGLGQAAGDPRILSVGLDRQPNGCQC